MRLFPAVSRVSDRLPVGSVQDCVPPFHCSAVHVLRGALFSVLRHFAPRGSENVFFKPPLLLLLRQLF